MRVRERADQGVGQHDSAYEIVGEVLLDGHTDRFLEEHPPGVRVTDPVAERLPAGQRFGEGREDPLGDLLRHAVEALPGRVLALAAGERGEGLPGGVPADEQSGGAAAPHGRCVRGDGPLAYGEVQPEIADDLLRQQGHQIRVARQPRVDSVEGTGRDGRSAGGAEAFEDKDGLSGAGEVGGGDQTVVAAAHDHCVIRVRCGHGPLVTRDDRLWPEAAGRKLLVSAVRRPAAGAAPRPCGTARPPPCRARAVRDSAPRRSGWRARRGGRRRGRVRGPRRPSGTR